LKESGIVDLMSAREIELAANLAEVRQQVSAAALSAGRDPSEVTIIGVTKNFPASDAAILAEMGLLDLGENRAQEAEQKARESALLTAQKIKWHFIGQLQRNKVRSVLTFADVIHSVDRMALVDTLKIEIERCGKSPSVLIQINLDPAEQDRGGVSSTDLLPLADAIVANGIRLGGVMSVAPIGLDPGAAFDRLAIIHAELLRHHPTANWRSAGMSGDFQAAIKSGATHLRLGSSILGSRLLLQ
jgi:pyridoxal phosphate enzyme (YggS family)